MAQIHADFRRDFERSEGSGSEPFCLPDAHGHCVTCADEALPATVLQVQEATWTAVVDIAGQHSEVDISLVDHVTRGQQLLVHGGVALGTLGDGVG